MSTPNEGNKTRLTAENSARSPQGYPGASLPGAGAVPRTPNYGNPGAQGRIRPGTPSGTPSGRRSGLNSAGSSRNQRSWTLERVERALQNVPPINPPERKVPNEEELIESVLGISGGDKVALSGRPEGATVIVPPQKSASLRSQGVAGAGHSSPASSEPAPATASAPQASSKVAAPAVPQASAPSAPHSAAPQASADTSARIKAQKNDEFDEVILSGLGAGKGSSSDAGSGSGSDKGEPPNGDAKDIRTRGGMWSGQRITVVLGVLCVILGVLLLTMFLSPARDVQERLLEEANAPQTSADATSNEGSLLGDGGEPLDAFEGVRPPIKVYIVGAVNSPGLVELPAESRVDDAIRAAGGLTKDADPLSVNLAKRIHDEEQVIVYKKGENPQTGVQDRRIRRPVPAEGEDTEELEGGASAQVEESADASVSASGSSGTSSKRKSSKPKRSRRRSSASASTSTGSSYSDADTYSGASSAGKAKKSSRRTVKAPTSSSLRASASYASKASASSASKTARSLSAQSAWSANHSKFNINKATPGDWTEVAGIDLSTALNIVEYRKTLPGGVFTSIDQLKNVSGVDAAKVDEYRSQLTL